MGYVIGLPNSCFAECLGFSIVDDGQCDSGIEECVITIADENEGLFQNFLLQIAESCDIELDSCILNAPLFETDEDFLAYLMENCFTEEDLQQNNSALDMYNTYLRSNTVSSVSNPTAAAIELELLQNPVGQTLRYQLNIPAADLVSINILHLSGQRLYEERIRLEAGTYNASIELGDLPSGIYLLNVASRVGLQTIKFVR